MALPEQTRALIIGGGVMGCATAYHLARLGWQVTLLEREAIGAGAGGRGPVTQLHAVPRLAAGAMRLFSDIGAEAGVKTGWACTGSLHLACNAERMIELRRRLVSLRAADVAAGALTPAEARAAWPGLAQADLLGALFLPDDGVVEALAMVQALAAAARRAGVVICEHEPVLSVEMAEGRVTGALTAQGRIGAEAVILCAGAESRALAAAAGAHLPLALVRRHALRVTPAPGLAPDLPVLFVPDMSFFCVPDGEALELSGHEPEPAAWEGAMEPDPARFAPVLMRAAQRVPGLKAAQASFRAAPSCCTPDGRGIIGALPWLRGLYAGVGFAGDGIALACGAARELAEWVAGGTPQGDLWPLDIRRFGTAHDDSRWVRARTLEAYALHDAPAWPGREYRSARPLRRSPLHHRLRVAGACFGEVMGYEQANWFAATGERPVDMPSYGRPNWFAAVGREHRAALSGAVLFDLSAMGRFRLLGKDAAPVLEGLSASFAAAPPGTHARALMLNAAGGVEVDADVARLAVDEFHIGCAAALAVRAADWITRHMPEGAQARLLDYGAASTVMALIGPRAADVLRPLADRELGQAPIPPGAVRRLRLAGTPVLALRLDFGGVEGFELHVPSDYALTLYDALVEDGAGLALGGARALETLRLEAGIRAWGAELTPDHTPVEAGLGHLLKPGDEGDYVGAAAIRAQAGRPQRKRLAGFTAPAGCVLMGGEAIYRNDIRVGVLASGGFGHGLGRALGYGYVRSAYGVDEAFLRGGAFALEVAGERVPCAAFSGVPERGE